MMKNTLMHGLGLGLLGIAVAGQAADGDGVALSFERHQLSDEFFSEGASFGDVDKDGVNDVVSGPYVYFGPTFDKKAEIYPPKAFNKKGYSDNFFSYTDDFDGDGWVDVLVLGFPGKEATWYKNPGKEAKGHWEKHVVFDTVDNESPGYEDVTGDGKREIVCSKGGVLGYVTPNWKEPAKPWAFHPISGEKATGAKFTHGLGIGDVNGDGRMDFLVKDGWWEQPESLQGDPLWRKHAFDFSGPGGAQMYAYDFDGDGDNDVLTSLAAHGYGLAWYEQVEGGAQFKKHLIVGESPAENPYGVCFSQMHGIDLVDVDGDGVKDIVTGKRHWAHNGHDPGGNDPAVLYWFRTVRKSGAGGVDFVPYQIDDDSGVGVGVVARDLNGDKLVDILVGNKKGTFVHLQRRGGDAVSSGRALRPPKRTGLAEKGYTPDEALEKMTLMEGFNVELVAAEPEVKQPIAMTIDSRGRIWVAEAYSYPFRQPDDQARDRILIFEDQDGDGKFETRKVFTEGLNLVSGLEVGFGGVWVGAAPYLMFIPDKDGDDRPDGAPEILLDGWGYQDTHETLNAFNWGPDGWLYGCHGVFTHSKVGKPGTPEDQRQPINAGVWRYHPEKHQFEVFAWGSSNPWGVDFDDYGQAFITACVIPHLYHVIQGARYQRQGGQHFNPYVFDDIKTIADHPHYAGSIRDHAHWGKSTPPPQSTLAAGGGHAHCGLAIYLADNFPKEFRGNLLFDNIHGHGLVRDRVVREGSGYVGRHAPDFMYANDRWFMGVAMRVGPDGGMYLIDWYDTQNCHRRDQEIWDRSNGRLYKVAYGKPEALAAGFDVAKMSDAELVELQLHQNDWWVRTARRVLQERALAGKLDGEIAKKALEKILGENPDGTRKLRALWALHVIKDLGEAELLALLDSGDEYVRGWAIQFLAEDQDVTAAALAKCEVLAKDDPSPVVRLYLAALGQRLPLEKRWKLVENLVTHQEDAEDHNLPLMDWYAAEPLVMLDPGRALELAGKSAIPTVSRFIYRRLAVEEAGREQLLERLTQLKGKAARQKEILAELAGALRERANIPMPKAWDPAYLALKGSQDAAMKSDLSLLGIKFGDKRMLPEFRNILANPKVKMESRKAALETLLAARDPEALPVFHQIIRGGNPPLRGAVIRALAGFQDERTVEILLNAYHKLNPAEKADAVQVLASNKSYALALLAAVGDGRIPRGDIGAFAARQLGALKDREVNEALEKNWGKVGEASKEKKAEWARYKNLMTPARLKGADIGNGRLLYNQTCFACHQLFGEGNAVGPDLTGSDRGNLDYLLENIIDPSSVVGKDYRLTVLSLKDGRVVSGMVRKQNDSAVTVAIAGGTEMVIARAEIEKQEALSVSMMPEGILQAYNEKQAADLLAYLQSPRQVRVTEPGETVLQGEGLKVLKSTGKVRPQAMKNFAADKWDGDSHLWWTGAKPGDELVLEFSVPEEGKYDLAVNLTKARDYGVFDLRLDEGELLMEKVDLFSNPEVVTTGELSLGQHHLKAGKHRLSVKVAGANPAAVKAYMLGLDYLRLVKR